MSWVAKNLFHRLTTISAHMRYTSKDALAHPWITRNKFDKIPESFIDKISKLEKEQVLK
jgi:serine/threonine protein kinase